MRDGYSRERSTCLRRIDPRFWTAPAAGIRQSRRLIALLTNPPVVRAILQCLALPTDLSAEALAKAEPPPLHPPRRPRSHRARASPTPRRPPAVRAVRTRGGFRRNGRRIRPWHRAHTDPIPLRLTAAPHPDTLHHHPKPRLKWLSADVTIAMEMRTPLQRAASAELTFWINGEEVAKGQVERTVPAVFTASETFDVGMDLGSPVADDYLDAAPFKFEGTLKKLHFKYLEAE